jgi:hypothetical protein
LVSNQNLVTKVVEFTSRIQIKLVWYFSKFSTKFYKFLKINDFELRGGTEILQPGPRKDSNQCNWVLAHRDREAEMCRPNSSDGGKREPTRKVQGTRANLAGADVQVGGDRRGWNDGEPRRQRWSLITAAVFRRGGSPTVDRR